MNNSSSNPSDYEFLLRTLTEGNHLAKAESLKRFNTLILSDKKQFASYSKRIVIAIQQLMLEQKEDINLLASTLALQIINLNPRDIEFYIKTKLLRSMVINLGDTKPQIRKTSHYCLLAYVRMFKNFDDLIEAYIGNGITSSEWQLRQKAINSFQSILVMQLKYLNWSSGEVKKMLELLLGKLKDENGFVQKAAEQCLLSLSKVQEIRNFSKKLSPLIFNQLKMFCEQQYEMGNLNEIKLDIHEKKIQSERYNIQGSSSPMMKQNQNTISLINTEKLQKFRAENANENNSIMNIKQLQEDIGNKKQDKRSKQRGYIRKVQSLAGVNSGKELQYSLNLRSIRNPERDSYRRQSSVLFPPITNLPQNAKQQKLEQILGKKMLQDLKNDKDWKIRLQAIEQLQTKFQISKEELDLDTIMKNIVPILIKLLGDVNFKVALIALKILQQILRIPSISLQLLVPQIVDKISDNKVALRQNISKLIKNQYQHSKQPIWIDNLLQQVKKASNANVKQEILNILLKFYEEGNIPYSFQKILQAVYPLMDDLKTKIKIKTLDLLSMITIKSQKIDRAKNLLATRLNQVYYEMYLQKIGKQLRSYRELHPNMQKDQKDRPMRTSMNQLSRKLNKVGNTTSTSLQKFTPQKEANQTVKTAFYEPKIQNDEKLQSITYRIDVEQSQQKQKQISQNDVTISLNDDQLSKKRVEPRYLRRRNQKSVESRLSTTNYSSQDAFPPFADPVKQLKNIVIELKSQDWQISNEALNKMRRIVMHHDELLVNSAIKSIVPDLLKLIQSLRSTLSKNALVVMNELSLKIKKHLDPQFDNVFSKLLKKSLDTNSFISEEVKKTLINVCSNCNESKVVTMLTNSHISRAIPIKTAIVNILQGVTFQPKFFQKEVERIVLILIDYMNQGSLQIRQRTKNLLNGIIMSEKGPSIMKLIPIEHKNKLKKRQESILSQSKLPFESVSNLVSVNKEKNVAQPQPQEQYPKKKKKNKITEFPSEFQQIEAYLQGCQSSDWKIRLQNMTQISEICFKFREQLVQHKSNSRIIDVLSKQINDPNVKVAINALKIFIQMTRQMPSLVESSLSVIMNEIFVCFSSMKAEIRQLSEQFYQQICNHIEKWMLTQHICNGALYSIQKSKPIIIEKLTKLVPTIYKVKPNIFQKNVYPMINKLADENKPEVNIALKSLLEIIYTQIGEDCMSFLKQKAKNLIFQ